MFDELQAYWERWMKLSHFTCCRIWWLFTSIIHDVRLRMTLHEVNSKRERRVVTESSDVIELLHIMKQIYDFQIHLADKSRKADDNIIIRINLRVRLQKTFSVMKTQQSLTVEKLKSGLFGTFAWKIIFFWPTNRLVFNTPLLFFLLEQIQMY